MVSSIVVLFSYQRFSSASDLNYIDRFKCVVLMPVELETIIASTAGGTEVGYPDIEREIQQLNDVVR